MSNSFFTGLQNRELYPGSDVVRRFTRKITDIRDNYALLALLANANDQLTAVFADTREKSALFSKKDCFECLSPHNIAVVL
jgi:hypothetical protein